MFLSESCPVQPVTVASLFYIIILISIDLHKSLKYYLKSVCFIKPQLSCTWWWSKHISLCWFAAHE